MDTPDEGRWQMTRSEAAELTKTAEDQVDATKRSGSPDNEEAEQGKRRYGPGSCSECFYCNEEDPLRMKCNLEDYSQDRCYYCHEGGHKRANCEQLAEDTKKGEKESKTCLRCMVIKSIREKFNKDDPITHSTPLSLPTDATSYMAEQHLLRLKSERNGMGILEAVTVCLKYATRWGYTVEDVTEELLAEVVDFEKEHALTVLDPTQVVEQRKERLRGYLKGKECSPEMPDSWIGPLARALGIRITLITQDEDNLGQIGIMTVYPSKKVEKKKPGIYLIRHNREDQDEFVDDEEPTRFDSVIPGCMLRKKLILISQTEGECVLECPLTKQKYLLFQHPSPLSNLAELDLVINDESYSSVEQYYQASKFKEGSAARKSIMDCSNQFEIKRLGRRRVRGQMVSKRRKRKQLDDGFGNVMTEGLAAKFTNKGTHQDHLLQTSECILVESTHGNLWGIGKDFTRDVDPQSFLNRTSWVGANRLGIKLMRIRSSLIRSHTDIHSEEDATTVKPSLSLLEGEQEGKEDDQKSLQGDDTSILPSQQ